MLYGELRYVAGVLYECQLYAALGRALREIWEVFPEQRAETWQWAEPMLF